MRFSYKTENNAITRAINATTPRHWLIASVVFFAVICTGTWILSLEASERDAQRKFELVVQGTALRSQMNRELNRVLYLTSGLRSYLVARQKNLKSDEIENILAAIYAESRHIKNFTVAVGHRITYVHPLAGNKEVLGLFYPDIPAQWNGIKKIIDSGKPKLLGPVNLVQGGSGLIYRIPIFIDGQYWGLLSSVIDSRSLFEAMFAENKANGLEIAIRGADGPDMKGEVFWGDAAVFANRNAQLIDVDIPGGKWVLGVQSATASASKNRLWLLQGMVWLLGLALSWSTLIVLSQRAKLERLALFDALTGLPNRLLLDDRINRAMTSMQRDTLKTCLLMFVDLDRFKLINDELGHHAGDFALKSAANRIRATVREVDTVGRWGGDEFLLFMENVDRNKINELIAKIRKAVEKPVKYRNHEISFGISIGYALAPDDGKKMDDLLRVADERMYANKNARNAAR
jgi:diguanylate cyclase (GGDEF)-like protein